MSRTEKWFIVVSVLAILAFIAYDVHTVLVATRSFISDTQLRGKNTDQLINANLLQTSLVLGRVEVASRGLPAMETRAGALLDNLTSVTVGSSRAVNALTASITDLSMGAGQTLASATRATDSAGELLRDSDAAIKQASPLTATLLQNAGTTILSADRLLSGVSTSVKDLDTLVQGAAPIERHLDSLSAKAEDATGHTDAILADAEKWVDNLTHPKKAGFWREWATALLGPAARIVIDHLWPIEVKISH